MAIEEAGPDPVAIAAAIHAQFTQGRMAQGHGRVPVEAIAAALDIVEIRTERLKSIAGALLMPPDRNCGSILVDAHSGDRRRWFTIAHELGHYLSQHHRPLGPGGGFACTSEDMSTFDAGARARMTQRHRHQESEANHFAIELLAPANRLKPYLQGLTNLTKVLAMADDLELSKEAAARRYGECHDVDMAMIFSERGLVRYVERYRDFPPIALRRGMSMPTLPGRRYDRAVSDRLAMSADPFHVLPGDSQIYVQTLYQMNEFAITLLACDN